MKKYLSLLLMLSFIFHLNASAASCNGANQETSPVTGLCYTTPMQSNEDANNLGSDVCEPSNTYYNPTRLVNWVSQNPKSDVTYNIANIDIEGDTLNIYGWAFNVGYTNNLGGTYKNVDGTPVNYVTTIKMALSASSNVQEIEELMFKIDYANPNYHENKKLNYYNLTFWNCLRTSVNSVKTFDGKDSNGMCMFGATPYLWGGFKASINLQTVKDYIDANNISDSNFKVFMYVDSVAPKSSAANEEVWFPVAASNDDETVDSSVREYNNNSSEINISGLSDTAEVIVGSGRLMGSNGLLCSSPAVGVSGLLPGKVYYVDGGKYEVVGKGSAYRGPNKTAYYQTMYKVKTSVGVPNSGKVYAKPGSGWEAYIPASWVRFTGQMRISFVKEETPAVCPEGTKGPFTNYYMFLADANDKELDNFAKTGTPMHTIGENSEFSDVKIFQDLIKSISQKEGTSYSLNDVMIIQSDIVDINSSNVLEFYDKYIQVKKAQNKYLQIGDDYYLTHTRWCSLTSGTQVCHDSSSTPDYNAAADYAKRSMYAKSYNIIATRNSSNTGFQFDVTRYFYNSTDRKDQMMVMSPINSENYYHPAEYKISYCISEKETICLDDVTSAVCYSGDVGTKVVFHENDQLSTCTLEKDNHSGFTIVETTETNNYCTVACKDDLDIELPTTKETAAGQYFTLDNYTPKIKAKRTCVTSEINYDTFEADLKAAEEDMVDAYNVWQDYLAYYNGQASSPLEDDDDSGTEGPECCSGCCGECPESGDTSCCGDIADDTCSWEYDGWKTDYTGPNGTEFSESGCDGTTGCDPCGGSSSCSYTRAELKSAAYQNEQDKYDEYVEARDEYNTLIAEYRKCSSWLTETEYTFEPTVTFRYDDVDGEIFPIEYTFDYDDDVDMNGFNKKYTYWTEYAPETNEEYTDGGDNSADLGNALDRIKFNLVSCTGPTCAPTSDTTSTNEDRSVSNIFYTSKYIKREENVTYTYHLPRVYTIVPSGKVSTNKNAGVTTVELEDNAVPVNINTRAGTYNYVLKITDIEDDLRRQKKPNNSDDDFEERFNAIALNAGEDYVCNYKVVNDIYMPDTEDLNFFYRTIDLADINPNNRRLGYNWSDARAATVIERLREASESYQVLTNSADRDRFSFTLTPTIMKQIRNYNATKNNEADGGYSDWDLYCADYGDSYKQGGYHCYSNFLTCLASAGSVNENKVGISCNSIFDNTLSNYRNSSNYDESDLKDNREILINKQNALDGR